MRFVKIVIIVLFLVVVGKYFPPFYYSSQFTDVVKEEASRAKTPSQLRRALIDRAEPLFIPVRLEDIQIKENGQDFKLNVDYEVPVNLFVYTHRLTFRAAAEGRLPPQY